MSEEFLQKLLPPFEQEETTTVSADSRYRTGHGCCQEYRGYDQQKCESNKQGKVQDFFYRLHSRPSLGEDGTSKKNRSVGRFKALVIDDDFNTCDSMTKDACKG